MMVHACTMVYLYLVPIWYGHRYFCLIELFADGAATNWYELARGRTTVLEYQVYVYQYQLVWHS
jgi:hypothetical protein